MRIGVYKDTFARGRGADIAVRQLVDGLVERGHAAVAFEKAELVERLRDAWDVVISTGTNELLDLNGFAGAPIVQQFHTNPRSQFKRKRLLRNWKIRRALRRVAAIQVLQEAFVPQVAKYGPPVSVIGNWSGQTPPAAPCEAAAPVIIYPAAFAKAKNQDLLIKAFASLHRDFPDWTLELYGDGAPDVEFPPAVNVFGRRDLREIYGHCAFLAFPSLDEGFGLAIADAAVFGLPAVMVRDWIGTVAADGGIVTASTVPAYADGLRRLMSDLSLCRRLGENARRFCAARYSREKILDQWEELLESVVK